MAVMTGIPAGLQKIIEQIQADADAAAGAARDEARRKADQVLENARLEGESRSEAIRRQSRLEAEDLTARAASAAALQKRKELLTAKQQLIGEVMERARERLCTLEPAPYLEAVLNMVRKYALPLPEEGEILFSRRDLERLPKDLERRVQAAAKEKGAVLKLGRETRDLDGGFVLVYGGVEENCSVGALFDAERERLQDAVNALLFPEGGGNG